MILVSICDHGGRLVTLENDQIIPHEVRGMAAAGRASGGWLWAASGSGISKLRGMHLYRLNGRQPATLVRSDPEATRDWHGVRRRGRKVYASNCSRIIEFDSVSMERGVRGGAVPGEVENKHLNDFDWHPDLGWIATQFLLGPVVYKTGRKLYEPKPNNPHSLTVDHLKRIWFCDSNPGSLLVDGREFFRREGRYCRGLCVRPTGDVLVGFSSPRGTGGDKSTCEVVLLDPSGMPINEWVLPYREIYQILEIPE